MEVVLFNVTYNLQFIVLYSKVCLGSNGGAVATITMDGAGGILIGGHAGHRPLPRDDCCLSPPATRAQVQHPAGPSALAGNRQPELDRLAATPLHLQALSVAWPAHVPPVRLLPRRCRLREHNERRRRREGEAFVPKDMVDLLGQLAEDPNLEAPIDQDGVKASILELIVGEQSILRTPHVLAMATDELDRVVGGDRLVAEGDIPSLHYLGAVVKETMRLYLVVPLLVLVPRVSREDHLHGAGTRVLVDAWSIGREPTVWGHDAGEFGGSPTAWRHRT